MPFLRCDRGVHLGEELMEMDFRQALKGAV
jgi:hypothetical protein